MRALLKYLSLFVCFSLISCSVFKGKNSPQTTTKEKSGGKVEKNQEPIKVTARSLYQQNQRLSRQNTALMKNIVQLQEQMIDDRASYEKKLTRMDRTIALMEKHLTKLQKNQTKTQNKTKTPPKKTAARGTGTMDSTVISTLATSLQPNEIKTPGKSGAIESFSFDSTVTPKKKNRDKTVFQPTSAKSNKGQDTSGWEDSDLTPPAAPLKLKVRAGAKKHYNSAFKQYAEKNYATAIEAFKTFIEKFPNDQDADNAQFWVGYANYHLENHRQSEFEFRKVLRNYQHRETKHGYKTPDTILMLGRIYLKRDKPIKARYYFEKLIELFPETRSALKAKMEVESMESF